jgi:dihydrofolate synthase / folylpolyglutamate synthase
VVLALLDKLGNPHIQVPYVHVAGTNGKGSTCAMIASVLQASGFKTGLYTSPHLIHFSERFRINGVDIPEAKLMDYMERLELAAQSVEADGVRAPTFFEISTALAFLYFYEEKVELGVLETGMGGRWDCTNVVIPLLSVISHIDIDHVEFLGDTIGKIASEKAGIIKPGRPVVSAPQVEEAMIELRKMGEPVIISSEVVSVVAKKTEIATTQPLKIETQDRSLPLIHLPLTGTFQQENCGLAVAALEVLSEMIQFEPNYKPGLESVAWSARCEVICGNPVMILDGAHNPSAARALVKTLRQDYAGCEVGFVLGMLEDKDRSAFLQALLPITHRAWTISIEGARGMSGEKLAMAARMVGMEAEALSVADALEAASQWACAADDRIICITGSLYLKQLLFPAPG